MLERNIEHDVETTLLLMMETETEGKRFTMYRKADILF